MRVERSVRGGIALLLVLMLLPGHGAAQPSGAGLPVGTVDTVAGSTGFGTALEVGVAATSVAVRDGRMWIAGDSVVREVNLATGSQQVVAGTAAAGRSDDPGPALAAMLHSVAAVTAGPDGALYVADAGNAAVRRVGDGIITTVAGSGVQGGAGDGTPAVAAQLFFPEALAFDREGALYIADSGTNTIRRVGREGVITRVAGTGTAGGAGDGGQADQAQLHSPSALSFDAVGNLLVADTGNHRIRRIDPAGIITTLAGTGEPGFAGDGGAATAAALDSPAGVLAMPDGTVLVADTFNNRIRSIAAYGTIATIAGNDGAGFWYDGGPATVATSTIPSTSPSTPTVPCTSPTATTDGSGGSAPVGSTPWRGRARTDCRRAMVTGGRRRLHRWSLTASRSTTRGTCTSPAARG